MTEEQLSALRAALAPLATLGTGHTYDIVGDSTKCIPEDRETLAAWEEQVRHRAKLRLSELAIAVFERAGFIVELPPHPHGLYGDPHHHQKSITYRLECPAAIADFVRTQTEEGES